jgi:toxin ParE1/3/4
MADYRLTNEAIADLSGIWQYTFQNWSESQADKYYLLLADACQELANHPNMGKKYENLYPGLLGFNVQQHIVFYLVGSEGIEVVRILHSRMDLKKRLSM